MSEPGRRLELDGSYNFRDVGGYAAEGGRVVRTGRVFRADHLGKLSDRDLVTLGALGVRTVCDLRKASEREGAPDRLGVQQGVEVLLLPVGGEAAQRYAITAGILAGEIRSFTVDQVIEVYVRVLHEFAPSMGAALRAAADPARAPLVVHCTAGKDRTGLVIALLLDVLGVSDDDIGDDHELTDRYHFEGRLNAMLPQLEAVGVRFEDVASFLTSPREVILGALGEIRCEWGSTEAYLVGAAGLDTDVLAALRASLLTSV